METALLQYPIEKVFIRLQKILKKKGYSIVSSDQLEGKIKAHKRRFLRKGISLDINTSKIDEHATRVDLSIQAPPHPIDKKLTAEQTSELDLWNCIYNNF